ncbi:hypothetical protein [Streptomyces sp. TRM70350]|uniref:hypothetical protein n=1 Tax=Streptomyces sp. TRM70350 TaxID=2856165 RepID=UPI001C4464CC|nr:hypothetical protein [Streptomyces sp. TRM70350]MBV7700487.1 hypothetical protein [Streptomyces sp. TRM70350]
MNSVSGAEGSRYAALRVREAGQQVVQHEHAAYGHHADPHAHGHGHGDQEEGRPASAAGAEGPDSPPADNFYIDVEDRCRSGSV